MEALRPRSISLWLIVAAFVLYVLFSVQAIGEPGLYMDAVNPDYQVVRMLNPQSPTAIYELPGNMLFGRLPVLGSLYHGSYTTYLTLPFYLLFGGTMLSIRLAHTLLGLLILAAAALLLWKTTRSGIVTGVTLLALAIDPAFFLLFRTQAYLPLFPVFFALLALYVLYSRQDARGSFGAGVLLGLAAFGYFVYLFMLPGILVFAYYGSASNERRKALASLLGGIVVGLLPYALGYGLIFLELGFKLGLGSIHGYVHALSVNSGQGFSARTSSVAQIVWSVLTNQWENGAIWNDAHVSVLEVVKAIALIAAPLALVAFTRRPYPNGRAFALLGATTISFLVFAVIFGNRLGGHDVTAIVPLVYVLAAVAVLGLLERVPLLKRGTRFVAAAAALLVAFNGVTASAMIGRLATHGGVGYYSDVISNVPNDAIRAGDTVPYVFGDWGGMMPFIYLTSGRIPTFDGDHLQDALCTYGAANVVFLGSDATGRPPSMPQARIVSTVIDRDGRSGFAYEVLGVRPAGPRCGVPALPSGMRLPPGVDAKSYASTSGVYPSASSMCCFLNRDASFVVRIPPSARQLTLDVFVPGYSFYGAQRLTIHIDGRLAAVTPTLHHGTATPVDVAIPPGVTGSARVEIAAQYSFVPKDAGVSTDTNRYSVILQSVVAGAPGPAPAAITTAAPTPLPSTLALPSGIDRADAANVVGIYPSDPTTCCFIGTHAAFAMHVPENTRWLTMTFYAPDYSFYGRQRLAIRVDGALALRTDALERGATTTIRVPVSAVDAKGGTLRITIDPSFSFVPRQMGINGDTERLSVVLSSVTAGQ